MDARYLEREVLENQTQKMAAPDLKSAVSRCGKEFSARGAAIVQIGNSLAKPGKR